MRRQNCARWVFIFGVLAGLFFSSGEGIQLLPFPSGEVDGSKITFSVLDKNQKSYAFSVYSFLSYSYLPKSKFQKHTNHYLPGENPIFDRPAGGANFCRRPAQDRLETGRLRVSLVIGSQSGRAPPTT